MTNVLSVCRWYLYFILVLDALPSLRVMSKGVASLEEGSGLFVRKQLLTSVCQFMGQVMDPEHVKMP